MNVKFKVESIDKNIVRFKVVPNEEFSTKALKATGTPNFGQCELVIHDEAQLETFEVGQDYDVSFEFSEPEEEE